MTVVAAALGASMLGGGPVERPERPGGALAGQLDALRGANDLVRGTRADVGRDPALYPTAYGRLEAALATGRPIRGIRPGALADLARTDVLDTPAWRAHYVCLALGSSTTGDPVAVLERAGIREQAEKEALGYLLVPDDGDDSLTSLATRAAFLQTLTCLGHDDQVPRSILDRLASDTARAGQPVPALHAVEALGQAGVRARATRVLRDADAELSRTGCRGSDPIQRAALTLLRQRLTPSTRSCLLPALNDPDTQTRWLVRRALVSRSATAHSLPVSLPAPVGRLRSDGLVGKSPVQLGTLTATYNAARALTASAQQTHTPDWLERRLRRMGSAAGPDLDPSDRVLLAMICHRLALSDCGPQAEKGAEEAAGLEVPARLTAENQRAWYGAMAARAEFGPGCRRTTVELPEGQDAGQLPESQGSRPASLSSRSLRIAAVLADSGCTALATRLTEEYDLVARARQALRDGDLLTASDAVQAALASDQVIPQDFWDGLPALLEPYRDAKFPDLYAPSPGGVASADATRAAYYLLA
ncbi:hypothetical protein [Streptomyces graminofaciens]|uniref:hypothetical protein n=1 Tax=Streptomyces graminofaciens TaxID=68212 RepID=UPI002572DDA1|nr:hypothetical protein [Streptomyces graminofaciens]